MHYITSLTATAATLIILLQPCPAPPLAAIGLTAGEGAMVGGSLGGGAIAGGLGLAGKKKGGHRKRQDPLAGLDLPEQAANDCRGQLHGATITVSPVGDNGARFDGVPSACMTLATVFLGQNPAGQPAPIPMGSASLQYNNLTPEELQTLQNALGTKDN